MVDKLLYKNEVYPLIGAAIEQDRAIDQLWKPWKTGMEMIYSNRTKQFLVNLSILRG